MSWAASWLIACEPPVGVGVPWLELPPAFEVTAELGAPTTTALPLLNSGTGDAAVSAAVEAPFAVPDALVPIPPGGTGTLYLTFAPTDPAPVDGLLALSDGVASFEVPVRGLVDLDADDDGAETPLAGGDDCDDHDPARFPANPEVCNGVDDDCSGAVDDPAEPPTWHRDADGDGAGDPARARATCDPGPGWVADDTDCDDGAEDVYPGTPDAWYDGIDADCAGDDDWDRDRDGSRDPTGGGDDCDDGDPGVRPGLPEVWYDGTDQDCDGNDDDQDGDGDPLAVDCDDRDPAFGPSAPEVWYDGDDQDCDGNDDDQDEDGHPLGDDCDDLDPGVAPGLAEVDDGRDQDCDGWRDEGLWVAGMLVISELLENPRRVADADGRFVEVVNASDGDVDLGALAVVVGADVTVLAPGWLGPGEVAVWCANPDPVTNGGVPCTDGVSWTESSPASLAVGVAATALLLDEVPLGGFTVPNGASRELRADRFDAVRNDTNANWCTAVASATFGLGDRGTPGDPLASCP
jgi:hypothetical protein